ncbi:TPA: hypothetical protein ON570_004868 [Citrobacter werkmanii]|nr:hypothetical protein [Citrobacter werkmanii]
MTDTRAHNIRLASVSAMLTGTWWLSCLMYNALLLLTVLLVTPCGAMLNAMTVTGLR